MTGEERDYLDGPDDQDDPNDPDYPDNPYHQDRLDDPNMECGLWRINRGTGGFLVYLKRWGCLEDFRERRATPGLFKWRGGQERARNRELQRWEAMVIAAIS